MYMCICIFISISVMYMHTYTCRYINVYIYTHMYVWAYTNTLSCRIPEIDFVEISWKLFKHGVSAGHPCPFAESGHPMTGDLKPSSYGMGPPVDSVQLVYKWLNSMVYGRYNELVNGDYFMVYKPTYNWGGPSCKPWFINWGTPPIVTIWYFFDGTLPIKQPFLRGLFIQGWH